MHTWLQWRGGRCRIVSHLLISLWKYHVLQYHLDSETWANWAIKHCCRKINCDHAYVNASDSHLNLKRYGSLGSTEFWIGYKSPATHWKIPEWSRKRRLNNAQMMGIIVLNSMWELTCISRVVNRFISLNEDVSSAERHCYYYFCTMKGAELSNQLHIFLLSIWTQHIWINLAKDRIITFRFSKQHVSSENLKFKTT